MTQPRLINRPAVTLVEMLVVLTILGVLLALLLPAVQGARERARETVCKNNIYQIKLAMANFLEVHKKLPRAGRPGKMGGWVVDILPFIEQQNLYATISQGADVSRAPAELMVPPPIFQCPRSLVIDQTPPDKMARGHYTLVTFNNRAHLAGIYDSPIDIKVDWLTGPESDYAGITKRKGPHHGGMFFSGTANDGISLLIDGEEIR